MRPVRCAGCGGRETETRVTAPRHACRSALGRGRISRELPACPAAPSRGLRHRYNRARRPIAAGSIPSETVHTEQGPRRWVRRQLRAGNALFDDLRRPVKGHFSEHGRLFSQMPSRLPGERRLHSHAQQHRRIHATDPGRAWHRRVVGHSRESHPASNELWDCSKSMESERSGFHHRPRQSWID
jgi:hypothetical protein